MAGGRWTNSTWKESVSTSVGEGLGVRLETHPFWKSQQLDIICLPWIRVDCVFLVCLVVYYCIEMFELVWTGPVFVKGLYNSTSCSAHMAVCKRVILVLKMFSIGQ